VLGLIAIHLSPSGTAIGALAGPLRDRPSLRARPTPRLLRFRAVLDGRQSLVTRWNSAALPAFGHRHRHPAGSGGASAYIGLAASRLQRRSASALPWAERGRSHSPKQDLEGLLTLRGLPGTGMDIGLGNSPWVDSSATPAGGALIGLKPDQLPIAPSKQVRKPCCCCLIQLRRGRRRAQLRVLIEQIRRRAAHGSAVRLGPVRQLPICRMGFRVDALGARDWLALVTTIRVLWLYGVLGLATWPMTKSYVRFFTYSGPFQQLDCWAW